MPEEKKESFTFSDKIKSSKPAGSKSYAKSSSKIGRDGKPKQTLFERTRRDAPFFIAALVALLLLPFLYKYSGQSTSEETLLTPGSEESMFDPERYGFDTAMIEDPEGQVAQLSGRSSFDLIRGMGNDEEDYGARDDFDFDASSTASGEYSAEGEYEAKRNASTQIDEEENITNIYKRRARAATRAAFRRAPTAIGSLNPASLRRGSGNKLGINPWGGSIKEAANKVKASKPKDAPKPVSLQPLRAGGPARSSFGQGAAAAARKGLDNMGKANAAEALRDSYVKPVDPTRVGGLDLAADGHFGGGGKLDRNINIAPGREPWWWDMMKTRMQKEWEARFNYKWGWINWATDIAKNILKGLINCLITGNSDGDPDTFFGSGGGAGTKDPSCCGIKEKDWDAETYGPFGKASCNKLKKRANFDKNIDCKKDKWWDDGYGGGEVRVGPVGQRLKCLGINVGGYVSGKLGLNGVGGKDICEDMPYQYQVIPSGQARNWKIYTFVTARNYFPESLKNEFQGKIENFPRGGNLLCVQSDMKHGGSGFNHTGGTSAGAGYGSAVAGDKNAKGTDVTQQNSVKRLERSSEYEEIRRNTLEINPDAKYHSCVIYVQNSGTFNYEVFKNQIIDQFKTLLGGQPNQEELAQRAFQELDLLSVESVAMKDNLAAGRGSSVHKIYDKMLPMLYWEFENAYILHKGVTNRQNGHDNDISKKKYRVEGQDMIRGEECEFADWMFECGDQDQPVAILKTRKGQLVGDQWVEAQAKPNEFTVVAELFYLNGQEPPIRRPVAMEPVEGKSSSFTYVMNLENLNLPDNFEGNIVWTATHHNGATKRTIKHTCPFGTFGYTKPIHEKPCENAQQSADCCKEIMEANGLVEGEDFIWDPKAPVGSQCKRIEPEPECKTGNESLACCHQVMGPDYMWDPQHNPPCYKEGPQPKLQTRLAPVLSWVPGTGTTDCRKEAGDENNPNEAVFKDCSKVPGISRTKEEHCASQIPLMMDSQAAADFVKDVVAKYNASIANKPTEKRLSDKFYSNLYPTDGEFVDALFLARKIGIKEVPSSAVCELARDMVRMSKDPHAGHMQAAQGDDFKGLARPFRNDLGAFLVYVHPTSVLYPNAYYGAGSRECDWRFRPEGSSCNGRPSHLKMGKAFYYNYYNDSAHGSNLQAYLASFRTVGIKETYPLAQLVAGHTDLAHNCPNDNCASNRNKYNKDDSFGLMISDHDSVDGHGQACVAFAGGAKMSVDKAIEYVQNVCETGLDAKPYGNQYSSNPGPAQYKAGQKFKGRTGTRPGNDGGVQKPRG